MKQRPNNWPKRVGTFLNNYRAVIFLAAAILLSSSAFSQVDTTKLLQYINAYGYRYKNGAFDSSFRVPADTFNLSYKDTSALAIKNKVLYTWSGTNWKAVALKVNDTTFIINGDTVRVTTGGGSGTTDLTFSRNGTTVTVISSTGTDAVLPAATTSLAGVMTGAMKLSLDSAFTKRVVLNDSTTVYYNSKGEEVYRTVDSAFSFINSLEANTSRTAQLKNDAASPGANKVYGTDGSGVKGWKADPAGGGLSGLTTNRVPYATSSTTIADDAKFVFNSTTKSISIDSIFINGVNLNRVLRGLSGYTRLSGTDSTVLMAGAAVPTVNGDNTITWVTLFPGTGHNTYFVDTVRASSITGFLHVKFPHVARIVTWLAVPDDALANKGLFVGGSITLDSAVLNVTKVCQLGGFAYGNGTSYTSDFTTPQTGGSGSAFAFSYDNGTGTHTFSNIPVIAKNEPYSFTASLATSENWRIVWDFSGLSNYQMKFKIYDNVSNTVITGAPTSNHKWFLNGPVGVCQVNAGANSPGTDLSKNVFVSGSAIIFFGIGEK